MREMMTWMLILISSIFNLKAQNVTESDRKFIMEAAQANMLEVKLGELAQTHSQTDKVKVLGDHMITDHSKAGAELKELAAKKGVVVPTDLDEDGKKVYNKLVNKQGEDFDKEYTKCMVKDHKKDIGKFKKEADKGDDTELKAWAQKTLPTLEHHKTMSEEACKAVKEEKKATASK
jgi:putative membrane protein